MNITEKAIGTLSRHTKRIAGAAGTVALTASSVLISTADIRGSQAAAGQIDYGPGISRVEAGNWVSLNFLKWFEMTKSTQRKVVDSLLGKDVVLNIDTSDLRLHEKLTTEDHVQLDLNMDPHKYPQVFDKNYDGHPVELRVTKEQYAELKRKFGQVKDPQALSENSFPGDIPVTRGAILMVKVEKLPRGTNASESYSEFVLRTFILLPK